MLFRSYFTAGRPSRPRLRLFMTQIRGNEKRLPFPSERNALPTSEDDDPQRPPRNRFDSQGGSAPRSSNDFYSTTTAPLRDDPRRPSPRPRTSSAGTSTSVLDRGRPKSNASRPSSFFNPESTDDSVGQTSAECDGRGERGSGDWVEEEHLHEGGGRPSSFFGVSSSPGPESTYEDSQARREEDSPGPETERRSSFYGLEEQFPPSSSTPDCRSPSLPNGLRNFQANNDSSSNSSLSHEAPRGGVRYQTAPYAASRAASVHGMPSNDPAPAPLLDQSHLRPGVLASLLTHDKTLDLYRANAKKTNDPDIQFEFCTFVMEIVGEMEGDGGVLERGTAEQQADSKAKQQALIAESVALLSKLANRGHVKSQYFLADCYTQGVGTTKVRSELLLVGGEELTVRWSRDDEITTRRFRSSFWRASTVTRTPASVPLNAVSMGGGARRTSPKPSSSSGARTRSPHDDSPADLALVGEPPFSLILERCIDSV